MSQKKVKSLRRKFREIVNKKFSSIIADVAFELDHDPEEIRRWYSFAAMVIIMFPEKDLKEFLPRNFTNFYSDVLKNDGHAPFSGVMIDGNAFYEGLFLFAMKHSQNNFQGTTAVTPRIGADLLKNF